MTGVRVNDRMVTVPQLSPREVARLQADIDATFRRVIANIGASLDLMRQLLEVS